MKTLREHVDLLRKKPWGRRLENTLRFRGRLLVSVGDTNSSFWCPGWRTLDMVDADHICDIRKEKLPFGDHSVDIVNCSHVVEHLRKGGESAFFYKEVLRVLKPDGLFRVATPDADRLLEKYREGDWAYFLRGDGLHMMYQIQSRKLPPEVLLIHNRLVGWFASYSGRLDTAGGPLVDKEEVDRRVATMDAEDFSDWCMSLLEPGRIYAHVNVYTYERLKKDLLEAKFQRVERLDFNQSSAPEIARFHVDREAERDYSIYCDAMP
ncbi:MAG: methyltransferase domain-containing protein [Verrucomicrobia bacterium]|nr:methyltransferase domain-containing protein [Verrucomicrobiota bacterium]MBU1909268.1 methyltransferase domain-containing protein [Verrucomicrobiota bacterium]